MYHKYDAKRLLLTEGPGAPVSKVSVESFESIAELRLSLDRTEIYGRGVGLEQRSAHPKVPEPDPPEIGQWKIGSIRITGPVNPNYLEPWLFRRRLDREEEWAPVRRDCSVDPTPIPGSGHVAIWDGGGILLLDRTGKKIHRFPHGRDYRSGMSVGADGRYLVFLKRSGDDYKICVADLTDMSVRKLKHSAYRYAWLDSGTLIFHQLGPIRRLDLATGEAKSYLTNFRSIVPKGMTWGNDGLGRALTSADKPRKLVEGFCVAGDSVYWRVHVQEPPEAPEDGTADRDSGDRPRTARAPERRRIVWQDAVLKTRLDKSGLEVVAMLDDRVHKDGWLSDVQADERGNVQIYNQSNCRRSIVYGPDEAFYAAGWRPLRTSADPETFRLYYPNNFPYHWA